MLAFLHDIHQLVIGPLNRCLKRTDEIVISRPGNIGDHLIDDPAKFLIIRNSGKGGKVFIPYKPGVQTLEVEV